MSGYVKGSVDVTSTLGTLASKDVTSTAEPNVMTEAGRVSSLAATWSMNDFTDAVGDGPISVGVAHSDYSDAEIEEFIENAASWDRGDMIAQEVGKRKIRQVGVFSTTGVALSIDALNDGRPIKTKLNWPLSTGDTLRFWSYNQGSSALGTGAVLTVLGHANLFIQY